MGVEEHPWYEQSQCTSIIQQLTSVSVPLGGDIIEVVSPFRSYTPASRQLEKHGDGGYMIIMQTADANARRQYIERNGLAKVIFSHEMEESVCIQYHPKGIKGSSCRYIVGHGLLVGQVE